MFVVGAAVNETNAAAQEAEAAKAAEAEELEMEGEKKENKIDPMTLSVPVVVVAPKPEDDFHAILLKTAKEATKKRSTTALVEQMQEAIKSKAPQINAKQRIDLLHIARSVKS